MLMRTDPFRDLDRLTQQVFGTSTRPAAMPIDAYRDGEAFVVEFDLPGVDPASIDLTVEKNVLSVHARRERDNAEGVEYLVGERPHGTFSRQLFLGESLDTDRIDASYADGVLTIRLPVAEKAKARRVEVTVGDRQPRRPSTPTPTRSSARPTDARSPARLRRRDAALYTVGQVAGMLDVQPAFLRRLDDEQVVQPARSDGGQRRYSRVDIAAVRHVAAMADDGMSLAGIRRILVLEAEVAALKARVADLQRRSSRA